MAIYAAGPGRRHPEGDERIQASQGDDTVYGYAGDDYLVGNAGDDRLVGGSGTDTLVGGAGRDTFVFAPADGNQWGEAADLILDFTKGQDRIGLGTYAGTFAFVEEFSVGQAVRAYDDGIDTRVQLDIDGDGAPDAEIRVAGHVTLDARDFIL